MSERIRSVIAILIIAAGAQLISRHLIAEEAMIPASESLSCKLQTYEVMRALDSASNEMNATKGEQLSQLRQAIHQVPKDQKLPKDLHDALSQRCSEFFWDLGDQLKTELQRDLGDEWTRGKSANQIVDKIKQSSSWKQVSPEDAQKLANSGVIVEALKHGADGEHGHVATVSPTPENTNLAKGREFGPPFVRDGNEHVWTDPDKPTKVVFPSSRGAVSYARAFCERREDCVQPEYYAWLPSWNAAFKSDLQPCSDSKAKQAKAQQSVPAKNAAPKGNSHTGLWLLGGGLAGGAAAGGAVLASQSNSNNQSSSSSSAQVRGQCLGTSPTNACGSCTCTPNVDCNASSQCGGSGCWTSSSLAPFCHQ